MQRICIFCGEPPEDKNKEHPLPRWLLAMTGDPNRVVRHGYRWSDGKIFEFSFDSLVFPACSRCNERFSAFEGHAKAVIETLCRKEALSAENYVFLLDWLDKVRIGLWLGYRYLQQNPFPPNFTINSRLGTKDRMVAVYPLADHQKGLNTWGPESRLFQIKPSVFTLRINNILLLNASWDFMCASRCGYPYPRKVALARQHPGMLAMSQFRSRRKISHPIMSGIMKSSVTLFQPILQPNFDGSMTAITRRDLDYHLKHAWPGRNNLGPLCRQFLHGTVEIEPDDPSLEFDSISLAEARRAIDLASQAYSVQNESIRREPTEYDDGTRSEGMGMMKIYAKENRLMMQAIRSMPQETYNAIVSARLNKFPSRAPD
jgi:hypothetical protein